MSSVQAIQMASLMGLVVRITKRSGSNFESDLLLMEPRGSNLTLHCQRNALPAELWPLFYITYIVGHILKFCLH